MVHVERRDFQSVAFVHDALADVLRGDINP
jgi:hypothetical protein